MSWRGLHIGDEGSAETHWGKGVGSAGETGVWLEIRKRSMGPRGVLLGFFEGGDVEFVFRSTELWSAERDATGVVTFHIHSHVIVHLTRKLPEAEWSSLLGDVRRWWGFHFDDGSAIRNTREAGKYVLKPADLERLSAREPGALHHQLFRHHLVQPMGALKAQRKVLEEDGT